MNQSKMFLFWVLSLAFFLNACQTKTGNNQRAHQISKTQSTLNKTKALNKQEIIKKAENFVKWQGYTGEKTDLTMEQAVKEKGEFASNVQGLLQIRQNTLQKKAVEARLFKKQTHWAVGFDYINREENVGRCVIMDTSGQNIYMKEGQLQMDWLYQEPAPKSD